MKGLCQSSNTSIEEKPEWPKRLSKTDKNRIVKPGKTRGFFSSACLSAPKNRLCPSHSSCQKSLLQWEGYYTCKISSWQCGLDAGALAIIKATVMDGLLTIDDSKKITRRYGRKQQLRLTMTEAAEVKTPHSHVSWINRNEASNFMGHINIECLCSVLNLCIWALCKYMPA